MVIVRVESIPTYMYTCSQVPVREGCMDTLGRSQLLSGP